MASCDKSFTHSTNNGSIHAVLEFAASTCADYEANFFYKLRIGVRCSRVKKKDRFTAPLRYNPRIPPAAGIPRRQQFQGHKFPVGGSKK